MIVQRVAMIVAASSAALGGAIGISLPTQAQSMQPDQMQSRQADSLQTSVQEQQSFGSPSQGQQLNGLANQINETANPEVDSSPPGVYSVPNVQGFPDNLVIIETGLDTSSPEDTIGDYAIGVSF